jgi:hypothetical protein
MTIFEHFVPVLTLNLFPYFATTLRPWYKG